MLQLQLVVAAPLTQAVEEENDRILFLGVVVGRNEQPIEQGFPLAILELPFFQAAPRIRLVPANGRRGE